MSEYDLDLTEDAEERPFNREHFNRILQYAAPYGKTVAWAAALTLCGITVGLAEPLLFRTAIDTGIGERDTRTLVTVLGTLLGLRVLQLFSQKEQIRNTNYLGQKILYDLRQELFEHIEALPFSFFDRRPAGKVISRITNDVNHIGNLASSGVVNLASQLISLAGIIAVMMIMNWRMAILSFTTLPVLAVVLTKVRWALESAWAGTRKATGDINAHLNETVQGLQVIQACGREEDNSAKFARLNRRYYDSYLKAVRMDQAFWPLTHVVGAVGTCIVVWYGSHQVAQGLMTIGMILAFVNYLGKFWGPISTFSRVWSQILSAMASAERVFGIMNLDTEAETSLEVLSRNNGPAVLSCLPPIEGDVIFEDVEFGYRSDEPVLSNVSFHVHPGQTIALVGPTGAGKTTIINLLAGFYLPTGGKVLVDGHDLGQADLRSYRQQLGIVLQETFLFSGTILDNLLFAKPDASMEEIEEALEASFARDFIEKLPGGYGFEVKERGSNLSAGQRQLLAFARAILRNPRILILDEATSSIDPETERVIQEAMKTILQGRTAFIIAHRLSTVRSADRIMVIEDGGIAEDGPHEELVSLGGLYARLYFAQFRKPS